LIQQIKTAVAPVWFLPATIAISESALLECASEGVLSRARELHAEMRRREFLRSRWLYRSISASKFNLEKTADGDVIWPEGLCGSLSHKQGCVALAVESKLKWKSLGVDLEVVAINSGILEKVMDDDEFNVMIALLGQEDGVSAVFSAKEAVFKAIFPLGRKMFWFDDAKLCGISQSSEGLQMTFELLEDFGFATCAEERVVKVDLVRVSVESIKDMWLSICGVLR
jgi:4'-phosphopantetheinyl transferase EntD